MKYKYVASYGNYVNCPTCDGAYGHHIQFFTSLKEFLALVQEFKNDREYHELYTTKGVLVGEVGCNYSRHSVSDIWFKFVKRGKFHPIDDGRGNKTWKKLQ